MLVDNKKQPNALEVLLYEDPSVVQTTPTPSGHPYERGMAVTISCHKQTTADLVQSLKRVYGSLLYGLTGEQVSRDDLRVKTQLPKRRKVMDLVASKTPLVVAGIHTYNQWDKQTCRGSYGNYGYQHLHLYAYGVHHYLPQDEINAKESKLRSCFCRYLKAPKYVPLQNKPVVIEPVGNGKYLYEFDLNLTALYDYLCLSSMEPQRHCWINCIAESKVPVQDRTPLLYIYKEIKV